MYKAISTIVLFSLLALSPWIQAVFKLVPDAPLNENRLLAKLPELNWETALKSYASDFQKWFNDHYPSRCFLIRAKTQLDYSLFNYSDRIHIGSDGWLYHRDTLDRNKPQNENYSDEVYNIINNNFKQLHDWLSQRGILLVVMDNELKDAFYPEHLPLSAPRRIKAPRYQQFRNNLASKTGCIFFDSSRIMRKLQSERLVFHKTDLHWNDPAAFVVGKELVESIGAELHLPKVKWKPALSIRIEPDAGNEANFMPLLWPIREPTLYLHQLPYDPNIIQSTVEPYEYIFQKVQQSNSSLPTTVIFGDSFVDGMLRAGLSRHFNSLYRARVFHCSLAEVLKTMPADTKIFIVQFNEQNLGFFGHGCITDYSKIMWPAPAAKFPPQP